MVKEGKQINAPELWKWGLFFYTLALPLVFATFLLFNIPNKDIFSLVRFLLAKMKVDEQKLSWLDFEG